MAGFDIGSIPFAGEFFSVLSALIWAFAVIAFKKVTDYVHPVALNLFKNIVSLILFALTIVILRGFHFSGMTRYAFLMSVGSGLLGIAISDTMLFHAFRKISAGTYAIVVCIYGAFVIFFSFIFLGERLKLVQMAGVALVFASIAWSVSERPPLPSEVLEPEHAAKKEAERLKKKRDTLSGLLWGTGAMAVLALSLILMKKALITSTPLDVTTVRILAASIGLLLYIAVTPGRKGLLSTLGTPQGGKSSHHWLYMIGGTVAGMYLAMITWVIGIKYAPASIATSLNQLSNVFVFILALLFLKEKMTFRKTSGVIVATIGAILIIL